MSSVPEYIQWRLGKSDPVFPTSEERLFKYADYGSEQKCEGDPILERPEDWEQAVRVDRSIRDMSAWGVDQTAFVSRTTMPLEELARRGFDVSGELEDDDDDYSCDSGFCFV